MEISNLLLVCFFLACFYLIQLALRPKLDPREPPLISAKVPLIGHILGLIRYGIPYYEKLMSGEPLPALTLNLLGTRVYLINSTSLVAAVQRNHKVISFDPFLTGAAHRMAGIKGDGLRLLEETESGGAGINNKVLHAMHPALLGPGLDQMNRRMIVNLQASLDDARSLEGLPFDLHSWCRRTMTVASTEAVYGRLNPYRVKEIEDSLWIFESNLSLLLVNLFPRITARHAYQARERINAAFVKYYHANGHMESSEMTFGRWKAQHDAAATTEDIARLETAAGIGILSNTVPSTFWTLFAIYSRPALLSQIREEVIENAMHVVVDPSDATSAPIHTIDLADIRNACPLLVSTFQETIRLRSNGAPTRVVGKDIVLNDQYLLKAGGILQLPARFINREISTWGADSTEFNPTRFITKEGEKAQGRPTGFMSFGASPNICPGRHFATGEILALVAMMVLRYDLTPVNGQWVSPKLNVRAMAASVTPPIDEFPVHLKARKELEDVKWEFRVTEGKGKFGLITG